MAEKKYLDLTGLGQYDAKIKAKIAADDATTLASAKSYADGLASNYDAAGAAATALTDAKAYTDGQVAVANEAAAAAKTQADKGVADAATAKTAADAAQADVDALETLVGTLPEGTAATTVVEYVNKKTEGIATDSALAELQAQLVAAQSAVDAIEADYLVEADKTELQGNIDTEEAARIAADEALDARVDKVETFFVTAEGETLDTALDTLVEIQKYITDEGAAADAMVKDIADNAAAIAAEKTRAEGVESGLDARLGTAEAEIDALQAAIGESGSVDEMIDAAVAAEAELREDADAALDVKITEAKTAAATADSKAVAAQDEVDALELVVAEKAAQSDIDALDTRVTTAEGKITTLEGKAHTHANAEVLDGITAALVADWNDAVAKEHEHANKDVLDGITSTLVANWNAAETNAKAYTDEKVAEFVAITTAEVDALFA